MGGTRNGKSLGPAVDPSTRELLYTSVSAITKFDSSQEGGCPRRWFYRYVERLPEPSTKAQEIGTQIHSQLEHYLKTGEDVLGKHARAGLQFLPKPGRDLLIEEPFSPQRPLVASGVPLTGFIDVVNPRGEYVTPEGEVMSDPPGTVEVVDHKTTSDLKWAKAGKDLPKTVQMAGYAEWASRAFSAKHVRLSHIYYQTRGAFAAQKVSTLVPLATIKERWYEVESTVEEMKTAAKADSAGELEANHSACTTFGGCPFRNNCSSFQSQSPIERLKMSLLSKIRGSNGASAPIIPAAVAQAPAPQAMAPKFGFKKPSIIQDESTSPDTISAGAAEPGKAYRMPDGSVKNFLCSTSGKFSFLSPAGGAPTLLEASTRILPAEAAEPKAEPMIEAKPEIAPAAEETKPKKLGRPRKTEVVEAKPEVKPEVKAGFHLFVNAIPGGSFKTLDAYIAGITKIMQEEFKVVDIRCPADKNSPLAFSMWRGVLASLIRNELPGDGNFVIFTSGNEISEVVAETLALICAPENLVRGVR